MMLKKQYMAIVLNTSEKSRIIILFGKLNILDTMQNSEYILRISNRNK